MDIQKLKFILALLLPLIYEVTMVIFNLDGPTPPKLIITGGLWFSFIIAFIEFLKSYTKIKNTIPRFTFIVLCLLLLWNILGVFRSLYDGSGKLTTLLGNISTALSLLVPFAIIFSVNLRNLRILHIYFLKVLWFGLLLTCIFFLFAGGSLTTLQLRLLLVILLPVIFMITITPYLLKKKKRFIYICIVILFYVAYTFGSRTMMIRELMLIACLTAIYIYSRYKFKWVLRYSFLLLLAPFILLQQSMDTGESAISQILTGVADSESSLSTDTRTFLYTELFQDLNSNNRLIIGKGAGGSYYSEYFSFEDGDSDTRLGVEVGVLAFLLKGGIISVLLNLTIFITAIYLAFFKSKNYYVIGIGYILLVHIIILFIENLVTYNSYNFIIWILTGVCLSNKIRQMSNREILRLFPNKIIYR